MNQSVSQASKAKSKSKIPWMIAGFFVILALLDSYFVYTAVSTHNGVRVESAYEKGLAYNDTIAAYDKQRAVGWSVETEVTSKDDNLRLAVMVKDKLGVVLTDVTLAGELVRPTHAGNDRMLEFTQQGEYYIAHTDIPLKGQWDVQLIVKKDDHLHRHSQRVLIP